MTTGDQPTTPERSIGLDSSDEADDWKEAPSRESTGDAPDSDNQRRELAQRMEANAPLADIPAPTTTFALIAPAFTDHAWLPEAHTARGAAISPTLRWIGVPAGARSLLVTFEDASGDDPDDEKGPAEVLWMLANIPPTPPLLPASAGARSDPALPYPPPPGDIVVPYRPPSPDREPKAYRFVVRALATRVDLAGERTDPAEVLASVSSATLAAGVLTVRYGRTPPTLSQV